MNRGCILARLHRLRALRLWLIEIVGAALRGRPSSRLLTSEDEAAQRGVATECRPYNEHNGCLGMCIRFIDTNDPCSKNVTRLKLTQAVQSSIFSLLSFEKRKLKFEL